MACITIGEEQWQHSVAQFHYAVVNDFAILNIVGSASETPKGSRPHDIEDQPTCGTERWTQDRVLFWNAYDCIVIKGINRPEFGTCHFRAPNRTTPINSCIQLLDGGPTGNVNVNFPRIQGERGSTPGITKGIYIETCDTALFSGHINRADITIHINATAGGDESVVDVMFDRSYSDLSLTQSFLLEGQASQFKHIVYAKGRQ
jgi:hypothetical protein